ncbi:hypothetical protein KGA66_23335 [Actinocrinis puniceicyclus]|uniref:Uncharacterized protein n=1 Tax=Actinocrinis puniceicyclus TaxID=977794 RepID=A0A8J7WP72_9ACTN|nr:hypothetical protein [Actinocrinis puniceicyclus]MBS2965998.1 hypothetical protein [Actinocrinis puniceicyclus]
MATSPKQKPGKSGTNSKQTSPKVASDAAHVLNDPKATPDEKSAAASALAQARPS